MTAHLTVTMWRKKNDLSTMRPMMIRTGNLCRFTVLAVATGTGCIYNLTEVVVSESSQAKAVGTTISEINQK